MGGAPTERELREEIVRVCRLMYERGYIVATEGNVSARLGEDRLLVTPSGLCKGLLSPDQLVVVDMEGRRIGPGPRPTTELAMHLEAYRRRPDIGAVVHAHPPITVALSIADLPLADQLLPELIVTLGSIPTAEYATPSTAEGAEAIRALIRDHDALILPWHGTLTIGKDPLDAYFKLERVEHAARIALILRQLGKERPLPPEAVTKLLRMRREMELAGENERASV